MGAATAAKEIYNILNSWTGEVVFSAEIECRADELPGVKLGLAVKVATKGSAYLSGADLSGADLSRADLGRANLSGADLSSADLSRADLSSAYLGRANLSGADLSGADLSGADLSRADLSGADLSGADLSGADLSRADLSSAYLGRANLSGADLSGADLSGADLSGANGAELAIARTRILPEGSLIGWKKLKNGTIAKLRIPEDARRSHAFGRKCRAEFVDVIEGEGFSTHDGVTKYAPGLRVTCDKWDENWQEECAGGIHFFTQKSEAEDY